MKTPYTKPEIEVFIIDEVEMICASNEMVTSGGDTSDGKVTAADSKYINFVDFSHDTYSSNEDDDW